jgi:fructose-bisphosphate aldolase, class II
VPVSEIQDAIKHGVRKINIDTDIRLAMTGAGRTFMAENPEKFDACAWLKPAREAGLQDLQAALPGVRLRGPGREDQALAAVGRCSSLSPRRAGAGGAAMLVRASRKHLSFGYPF